MSSHDLNVLDFTLNKYEHGWRRMIEDYFRAFPDTALALALSDEIDVPDYPGVPHDLYEGVATVQRIRDFALAKERSLKPGQKMWLGLRGFPKAATAITSGLTTAQVRSPPMRRWSGNA